MPTCWHGCGRCHASLEMPKKKLPQTRPRSPHHQVSSSKPRSSQPRFSRPYSTNRYNTVKMPSSRCGSQRPSLPKMQACVPQSAPPKPRPTFGRDTVPSSIRSSIPDIGQEQAQVRPYVGDQWQHGSETFDFSKKTRSGCSPKVFHFTSSTSTNCEHCLWPHRWRSRAYSSSKWTELRPSTGWTHSPTLPCPPILSCCSPPLPCSLSCSSWRLCSSLLSASVQYQAQKTSAL